MSLTASEMGQVNDLARQACQRALAFVLAVHKQEWRLAALELCLMMESSVELMESKGRWEDEFAGAQTERVVYQLHASSWQEVALKTSQGIAALFGASAPSPHRELASRGEDYANSRLNQIAALLPNAYEGVAWLLPSVLFLCHVSRKTAEFGGSNETQHPALDKYVELCEQEFFAEMKRFEFFKPGNQEGQQENGKE